MGQIAILLLHTHLLLGVASSLVIQSMPWRVPCPHQCVCQIKPWYSPQSVYREAPTVDCNDLLLIQLPTSLPQETQTLRMEENQLRHLPEAAFFGLPSLQELYLNHNRLRSISPGAFKGLDKLIRLHLNSNRLVVSMGLREVSERALEGLQNLESISFYDNHLIKVPKEALQKLPGLKFLDLNKNPIQLVQRGDFRNMLHLKELADNDKPVRFIEPQSTFCSEPPELKARRVKEVSFREMADSCLPLIAPSTFPSYIEVKHGDNVALHCRALAEPEPSIYWVIPQGVRLTPSSSYGRYQVLTEGTLEIFGVTAEEAGFYTCVAQNLVGADTRSLTLEVEGGDMIRANTQKTEDSFEVQDVKERYALLTWQASRNIPTAHLSWVANGSLEEHHRYSTRILAGTRRFNLTRLQPGTHYKVCLHLGPNDTSCVHLRTKEVPMQDPLPDLTPAVLLAVSALLLLLMARACNGGASFSWKDHMLEFEKPHTTIMTQEAKAFMTSPIPVKHLNQQDTDKVLSDGRGKEFTNTLLGQDSRGLTKEAC
ncbi:hypothetical protein PO909_020510 [Leuciscus waleckii]